MKLKQFQKELKKGKIGFAIFIGEDPNITYFSGFEGFSCLIIPAKKPAFLIVHRMEYNRARKARVKAVKLPKNQRFFKFIKKKIKAKTIGINKLSITLKDYSELRKTFKARFKDISKICYKLRQEKTEKELRIIKKAYGITDKIMQNCFKNFKNFKTEADVAAFLEYEAKKQGADAAFKTIVASGNNSKNPHHNTTNQKLKKGFCIIDFGIKLNGYHTDLTRTIYIGKPKRKEVYDYYKVLEAQEEAIKQLKPGVKAVKPYETVRKKLGNKFLHGLGHGIGVEIHELPNLTEKSKDKLLKNMVFTVEPGYYSKQGIRIEDGILLKEKAILLSKLPKQLLIERFKS